jgi:hypothetical protein
MRGEAHLLLWLVLLPLLLLLVLLTLLPCTGDRERCVSAGAFAAPAPPASPTATALVQSGDLVRARLLLLLLL